MSDKQYSTEEEFLRDYDPNSFERPSTAVDNVIFTVFDQALHVLIVKREHFPFKDQWSLVGGFIDLENDQNIESTAKRKLQEKTGVKTPYLEQLYTIGNKSRDPRGWSVTTVYFALLPYHKIKLQAGSGAIDIKWARIIDGKIKEKLAFDHNKILKECQERLRGKTVYTSLPVYLMPEKFTLSELQEVYEIVLGNDLDHKSFRRRLLSADILEETGEEKKTSRRPAMLYRKKKSDRTFYFTRNIESSN